MKRGACVMAAAPRLLAFAKAAKPILERELEQRECSGLREYVSEMRKLVRQCCAAIAKAEGRNP